MQLLRRSGFLAHRGHARQLRRELEPVEALNREGQALSAPGVGKGSVGTWRGMCFQNSGPTQGKHTLVSIVNGQASRYQLHKV